MNLENLKKAIQAEYGHHNLVYSKQGVLDVLAKKRVLDEKLEGGFSNDFIGSQLGRMMDIDAMWRKATSSPIAISGSFSQPSSSKPVVKWGSVTEGLGQSPALQFIMRNAARPKLQMSVPVKMMMAYYCKELQGLNYGCFTVSDNLHTALRDMSESGQEFNDVHGVSPITIYVCAWTDLVPSIAH